MTPIHFIPVNEPEITYLLTLLEHDEADLSAQVGPAIVQNRHGDLGMLRASLHRVQLLKHKLDPNKHPVPKGA